MRKLVESGIASMLVVGSWPIHNYYSLDLWYMTSIIHMLHRITASSIVDHNIDILEANHGKTLATSNALHIENMDLALLWIFASWSIHLQRLQQVVIILFIMVVLMNYMGELHIHHLFFFVSGITFIDIITTPRIRIMIWGNLLNRTLQVCWLLAHERSTIIIAWIYGIWCRYSICFTE